MSVPEPSIGGVKVASLLLAVVLYLGAGYFAFSAVRSEMTGNAEHGSGPRGAIVEAVERGANPEKFRDVVRSQRFLACLCAVFGLVPLTFFRRLRSDHAST